MEGFEIKSKAVISSNDPLTEKERTKIRTFKLVLSAAHLEDELARSRAITLLNGTKYSLSLFGEGFYMGIAG